jgi:hypothetical protein
VLACRHRSEQRSQRLGQPPNRAQYVVVFVHEREYSALRVGTQA